MWVEIIKLIEIFGRTSKRADLPVVKREKLFF
jgi:hypothetical protein